MSTRPNIVVVICHDLGHHLGCYGRSEVRSPNIDRFAEGGVRFSRSFCTAPQCSPSRAGLWTGRFAHANGVVGLTHGGFANDLHPGERHLVEILGEAGYDTHLFGIQHEARDADRCGYRHTHPGGSCARTADGFVDYITGYDPGSAPLFAQIGFFEPHRPFPHEDVETLSPDEVTVPPYLPDIPEVREDLIDIEASIASMDLAFGRIVEALRESSIGEETLLLFTADHGIAFPHAKMTLFDPGIEVPLILSGPGVGRGEMRDEMISNVDVFPTLLEYVGLPVPSNLHGKSFHGLLSGAGYRPNTQVFAEKTYHTYYDPMRAIRTDRYKLIANFENAPWQETSPDYDNNAKGYVEVSKALDVPYRVQYHPPIELFDLDADPYEQHNLADDPEYASIRDDLITRLEHWMRETEDPLLDGPMAQGAYTRRMAELKRIAGS